MPDTTRHAAVTGPRAEFDVIMTADFGTGSLHRQRSPPSPGAPLDSAELRRAVSGRHQHAGRR
jgi:hypothetical protein